MARWNIAVAFWPGCEDDAASRAGRLADAWCGGASATFTPNTFDQLNEQQLKRVSALVVLTCNQSEEPRIIRLLSMCEERHTPAVVLMSDPGQSTKTLAHLGAIVLDAETDPDHICATLHGLIHRQGEIAALTQEAALATRSHGGLRGEMAKLHEELQLAAMVQREYLPRTLPEAHGVSVGVLFRPANYVSGDIYDVIQLDDDHIGVFLADSVGHGVPAALMTMVIRQSLVTRRRKTDGCTVIEPSEVLNRLNGEMIRRQAGSARFATAIYAVVNCRTRKLTLAGAGHPPPLLMQPGAPVAELETHGGLLGLFEGETYDQVEVDLDPDSRLFVFSDGFEQAFPKDDSCANERRVPTTRYREEFERLCTEPNPQTMMDSLAERLNTQCGSLHQIDDVTLLCVHAGAEQFIDSAGPTQDAAIAADAA